MDIISTSLNGAFILKQKPIQDNRGFFARSFCKTELANVGINFNLAQANVAFNREKHTLRGMHFQLPPYSEEKIVSCYKGRIYDVIIDLNSSSSTYGKWFGQELSEENGMSLYVPKGFAHGYVTLTNDSFMHYMVSEFYTPSSESGIRWNDPSIQIKWPVVENLIISEKDKKWKDFDLTTEGINLKGE